MVCAVGCHPCALSGAGVPCVSTLVCGSTQDCHGCLASTQGRIHSVPRRTVVLYAECALVLAPTWSPCLCYLHCVRGLTVVVFQSLVRASVLVASVAVVLMVVAVLVVAGVVVPAVRPTACAGHPRRTSCNILLPLAHGFQDPARGFEDDTLSTTAVATIAVSVPAAARAAPLAATPAGAPDACAYQGRSHGHDCLATPLFRWATRETGTVFDRHRR